MLAPPDSRGLPSGSGSQLGSIPILSLTASRSRCLQPRYFCSLDGHMAEQELNLFQLSSRIVAESGTRSPEIVRSEFGNSQEFRVFLHNVPDYFLCNFSSPDNTFAANASENPTVGDLGDSQPIVDQILACTIAKRYNTEDRSAEVWIRCTALAGSEKQDR